MGRRYVDEFSGAVHAETCILCGHAYPDHFEDCPYKCDLPEAIAEETPMSGVGLSDCKCKPSPSAPPPKTTSSAPLGDVGIKPAHAPGQRQEWAGAPNPDTSKPKPSDETSRLPGDLENLKRFLIRNVVRRAYVFITRNGKSTLRDVIIASQKPAGQDSKSKLQAELVGKHLAQFKNVIKSAIIAEFDHRSLPGRARRAVVFRLVLDMHEDFADVELRDPGATAIIKNIIARMFFNAEELKKLGQMGAFK